jgi:hypothetical protein
MISTLESVGATIDTRFKALFSAGLSPTISPNSAQPIAFALQRLFVRVPLNCDTGDVARILNQLEVTGTGAT